MNEAVAGARGDGSASRASGAQKQPSQALLVGGVDGLL